MRQAKLNDDPFPGDLVCVALNQDLNNVTNPEFALRPSIVP
jgi:hypothetical protein